MNHEKLLITRNCFTHPKASKGPVWFVGMEEGLGATEGIPLERFQSTDGKVVVDITSNTSADHQSLFKEGTKTQPTWRALIFILLYQRFGEVPTLAKIRDYQINNFGRIDSAHAVLELMPLPAKSTKKADWIYQDVPLIGLTDREEYLATYLPERAQALKLLIEKHQPRLVLFYSRSYLNEWQSIIPKKLKEVIPDKLHMVKVGNTVYAVTPHPTSRGISTADWEQVTKRLMKAVKTTLLSRDEIWQKVLEVESQPDLRIQFWFPTFYDQYVKSCGWFTPEMVVTMLTSSKYKEDMEKLEKERIDPLPE
jgi:hypothetical protein